MNEKEESIENKVPMGQKIAFGFGMLANQMFPAALQIFMVVLVQDLGFPPILWGLIFFLPRFLDAVTDPIMGFISDNTKSKWGRRRQYIFVGALITGAAFIAMWQMYDVNGPIYNFWYFLSFSFLFYLGITIFSVPYVAMGYEMSGDFHERTNIMAIAQWIGQWAWVIAPWFWVIFYDPDWFESAEKGARLASIFIGIICTIFAIIPAIFVKSNSTLNDKHLNPLSFKYLSNNVGNIFLSFRYAFMNKPFRKLCIATFLIFNSFNTIAAFSFFIIVYYLFNGDTSAAGIWPTLHGCLAALSTTFLVIPVVTKMSQKIGKKKSFIITQGISIIGYILFWFLFVPGKPYYFIYALPFFSFGIGGLFTLMMSMTADVCDLDELQNGLPRKEATFGAIYWLMVKFGYAIAGLLSGLIMTLVGFDPNIPEQPEGAVFWLRVVYSVFPILGTLLAIYVMRNYEISEERAMEIKTQLRDKKLKKE
ncbi:MAG: MFS transporter [Flavobacteriaceae bacterium]|tara:strand:+ start:5287 stop:6720 length:1434 start_codon:yes stop_codon:yes gene_type:complete